MLHHIWPLLRKPRFYDVLTRKQAEWSSLDHVVNPENNIATQREDGSHPQRSPFYLEWWYFDLSLSDDSALAIIFHLTDLIRPNTKKGSLNVSFFRSGRPPLYRFRRYPSRQMAASEDKCDLVMGKNHCWLDSDDTYRIALDEPDLHGELTFVSAVSPWKPGSGEIIFGSPKHFFSWVVAQPRANVSGYLSMGKELLEIKGVGYHDHNWGTVSIVDAFSAWSWGRVYVDDYTIVYADMRLSPRYCPSRAMPFLLAKGNQHILTSFLCEHVALERSHDFLNDPKSVRNPNGWKILWEEDGNRLELHLKTRKVVEWSDLIHEHHPFIKFIFGLVIAHPYYIRCVTDVEGFMILNGQQIDIDNGKAICEQIILRKP